MNYNKHSVGFQPPVLGKMLFIQHNLDSLSVTIVKFLRHEILRNAS